MKNKSLIIIPPQWGAELNAQTICWGKKQPPTNRSNENSHKQLDNKNPVGFIMRISLSSPLGPNIEYSNLIMSF